MTNFIEKLILDKIFFLNTLFLYWNVFIAFTYTCRIV